MVNFTVEWQNNTTMKHLTSKMKVEITFKHYDNSCGDGCCVDYGTVTEVNGEEVESYSQDIDTILKGILEKLGYNVTIANIYED